MTKLVVDASVWVSAADCNDRFWESSRRFLTEAKGRHNPITVPAYAEVEVACALARRMRDTRSGRKLGASIFQSLVNEVHDIDAPLLARAVAIGTAVFLRAGDALYAALAEQVGGQLVSWDEELVSRAHAVTPEMWSRKQG